MIVTTPVLTSNLETMELFVYKCNSVAYFSEAKQ